MQHRRMECRHLGDCCVLVTMGETIDTEISQRVARLAAALRSCWLHGVLDVVPAFSALAVHFDPNGVGGTDPMQRVTEWIEAASRSEILPAVESARSFIIPVCYDEECAPDLIEVALRLMMRPEELVARHSSITYRVGAIGFSPGFSYMLGLPAELQVPRRATPRTRVPPGSVGIGGVFTGIYPSDTPGGWNLIGRTACVLFDPAREDPCLLRTGDQVRFFPADTLEETAKLR
ncbi:MAG: 5-oxoprolinase subunit PxpB [Opitutaceae bacterium]|nr:5-oxoprolinase subunit PxpB [Opitutaceae bacterium]